jgi:hypothetical protein
MYADVRWSIHAVALVRTGLDSLGRDHERRARRRRKELGSLGLFRTVGDRPSLIECQIGHSLQQRWDMFALTRDIREVYVTRKVG